MNDQGPKAIRVGSQPIVLLGGFLSFPLLYCDVRDGLAELTGESVSIVETQSVDWVLASFLPGWLRLLRKLDQAVQEAAGRSATGKITLIGHSAGGILGRLYLSPRPFLGRTHPGWDRVDRLITLGSPHYSRRRWAHGGAMARWVEKRYPGAFFAPRVRYTSVAGKLIRGDRQGSLRERHVYAFYEDLSGDGAAWGDGLIPVPVALLDGAQQITLEGVSHFMGFGGPWYGAAEVIPRWWNQVEDPDPPPGNGEG